MLTQEKVLEIFTAAIHSKKKVEVRFDTAENTEEEDIARICAPMDFAPHARYKDGINRFHFWNFNGPRGAHTMPVEPQKITAIKATDQDFDPKDFVTWKPNWRIARDWGIHS